MKAKRPRGMRELMTIQGLAGRTVPDSREQIMAEQARLEHERARLQRELDMWQENARKTAIRLQTDEHRIGAAFEESMPFAALLIVFFVIVAMIEALGLFHPVMTWALQAGGKGQLYSFFTASGILSAVSDNVFVGTIYVHQAYNAFTQGLVDQAQFDRLCLVINAGTNIFSILTPSGQAAFLFLLTSVVARKIELSYVRMFMMSLPYAIVLIAASYLMI